MTSARDDEGERDGRASEGAARRVNTISRFLAVRDVVGHVDVPDEVLEAHRALLPLLGGHVRP
ncbi:hypothetical protein WME94_14935 [Sorangium sp. So ce429]